MMVIDQNPSKRQLLLLMMIGIFEYEKSLNLTSLARIVGSNPTQSIFINLGNYYPKVNVIFLLDSTGQSSPSYSNVVP
jgi:hypothetical protein